MVWASVSTPETIAESMSAQRSGQGLAMPGSHASRVEVSGQSNNPASRGPKRQAPSNQIIDARPEDLRKRQKQGASQLEQQL